MSENHKPHDEHGAAHHDDPHPAPAGHGDHGHAAPDAHGHDDGHPAAPAHDDHAHAATDAHGHEAAPDAHGHDDHAPVTSVAHDDHGHAAHDDHAHAEPVAPAHDDHSHETHGHDDHGHAAPIAAAAVGGAAVAAAASHDGGKRPVWSDSGDAPFEDVDSTPVYARGKGGKGGKRKAKSGGSAGSETVEIIKTIFFALLIALVLRVLLFQPFTIPSASMEPNLYEGDYIVVSKWSYGYSKHAIPFSPPLFEGRIMDRAPERGDIVVFKLPRDNSTDYIKRVIGLPGDRIQMINNQLFINGTVVNDVVVSRDVSADAFNSITKVRETLPGGASFTIQDLTPTGVVDNTEVYEVPAGHYFMMGDNRDNSVDSRYGIDSGVGFVPAENLIGKAEIIMFSWEPGASLFNPVSWFQNIRPSRFFTVLD